MPSTGYTSVNTSDGLHGITLAYSVSYVPLVCSVITYLGSVIMEERGMVFVH